MGHHGLRVVCEIWPAWGFPTLRLTFVRRPFRRPEGSPAEWALGAVRTLRQGRPAEAASEPDDAAHAKRERTSPVRRDGNPVRASSPGRLIEATGSWLSVLRAALSVRSVRITARVGAGDAAQTAILCGLTWSFVGALMPVLPQVPASRSHVSVTPDYHRKIFDGEVELEVGAPAWRLAELAAFGAWLFLTARRRRARGTRRVG